MPLQPERARDNKRTLSLFWKASAEFLHLLHAHKPIVLQGVPQLQIDSQLELLLTSVCVGARLYRTGPSEVALSGSKWQKRKKEGKGKRKGRKREYLDKLTKQICRHHPLFFNTISYIKFLPPPTHTLFHAHKHTSQQKFGENGCLELFQGISFALPECQPAANSFNRGH